MATNSHHIDAVPPPPLELSSIYRIAPFLTLAIAIAAVQGHYRLHSAIRRRRPSPPRSSVVSLQLLFTHHFPHHRQRNHCYRYCRSPNTSPRMDGSMSSSPAALRTVTHPSRSSGGAISVPVPRGNNLTDRISLAGLDGTLELVFVDSGFLSIAFFYQFPQ